MSRLPKPPSVIKKWSQLFEQYKKEQYSNHAAYCRIAKQYDVHYNTVRYAINERYKKSKIKSQEKYRHTNRGHMVALNSARKYSRKPENREKNRARALDYNHMCSQIPEIIQNNSSEFSNGFDLEYLSNFLFNQTNIHFSPAKLEKILNNHISKACSPLLEQVEPGKYLAQHHDL